MLQYSYMGVFIWCGRFQGVHRSDFGVHGDISTAVVNLEQNDPRRK